MAIGRYTVDAPFASGGMATVHLGRIQGPMGFARTVAVKRLLPSLAADPLFAERFLGEARLAARIRHANVVPTLDVVREGDDLLIVMEYVAGLSLSGLLAQPALRFGEPDAPRLPLAIVTAIVLDVLEGLHAAHSATSETGEPLGIVHRDVSPQNVLVGVDGAARLIDFGIATAWHPTNPAAPDVVQGKRGYMAPEQLAGEEVTRAADVYATAVMLWELLAHRRLAPKEDFEVFLERVLLGDLDGPRVYSPEVPIALEEIVLRGLAPSPARRFESARAMATAIHDVSPRASAMEVAGWLERVAGHALRARAADVTRFEATPEASLARVVRESEATVIAFDRTMTMVTAHYANRGRAPAAQPPKRRAPFVFAALGVAALAVGGAAILHQTPGPNETAEGVAPPSAPPSVAALGETAASRPTGVDTAPSAGRGAPPPVHRAVNRAAIGGSEPDCRVPFYFDAQGTKRYRPECMR